MTSKNKTNVVVTKEISSNTKFCSPAKIAKKEISVEKRLVAIFIAYYMGWGITCHSIAILILSFSSVCKSTFTSLDPVETTFTEAAKILLNLHSFLIPDIRTNNFDIYVRYCSDCHSNYDMGYDWFITLDEKSRIQLFTDYTLEQVSEYLHLTQKNRTSFLKTLHGKSAIACSTEYITWHNKYKDIRMNNSKIKR